MTMLALPAPASFADPRREIAVGGAIVGLFAIGFGGWSAVARLDSAVHLGGVVRVAGNRQAVQTAAGGIVTALGVHEGDRVRKGQLLVGFATTETVAQERSLASRVIGLQAEIARIRAEQAGQHHIAVPPEWSTLDTEERADAAHALASEEANLAGQRNLLAAESAVLRQRIAQTSDQIGGNHERQNSNDRQAALNQDELSTVQDLYRQGYATKSRVLALQRSAASIDGDIGATRSEIARLGSSAGETRLQIMQLSEQRQRDNADRLRSAQTELDSLLPQWKAAREQLARSAARAPVSGTVIGLQSNTVGGFAAAGQKLMEIVPDEGALQVEAQVSVGDAGDLHAGQPAKVRLSGIRGSGLEPLAGTVSRVSADSVTDEKSGKSYYTATISVPRRELDRAGRLGGIDGGIRPGTPMDVAVVLRPRTALQYWMAPFTERLRPALSER
jgi:HlyD family secretion protein